MVAEMTYAIAMAAAQDAGDRSARLAGRDMWNGDDYDVAVMVFNRLWPAEREASQ